MSSKAIYFDPQKISFLVFEEKSPQFFFLSVSNVFKAKAEKFWTNKLVDHQKSALLSFETKLFFLQYFSFVLALKTLDAQMLFWSIFLKTH